MRVGDSVRRAIDEAEDGEMESAVMHACNAVDGTARKVMPKTRVGDRFTTLLRDNAHILGPMALPGIDILASRFAVELPDRRPTHQLLDLADLIYLVHRCSHGHGDELPQGFELMPNALEAPGLTTVYMDFGAGRVRLSDRVIFGLLGVAVLSPANRSQRVPNGYYLTLGDSRLDINDWWGRADDFDEVAQAYSLPSVVLDPGPWPSEPGQPG